MKNTLFSNKSRRESHTLVLPFKTIVRTLF